MTSVEPSDKTEETKLPECQLIVRKTSLFDHGCFAATNGFLFWVFIWSSARAFTNIMQLLDLLKNLPIAQDLIFDSSWYSAEIAIVSYIAG
ncbi:18652_t:CDS:2, partial [Acaulospora morrowiae]